MKVEFYLGIGFANAEHKEIVDIPDSTPEEEIEEYFNDWMTNYLDCGWSIVED